MKKKYLIYADILGFEKLPRGIAKETSIDEDVFREKFLTIPLREEITNIKKTGIEVSHGKSEIEEGSDNYVLMVDTFETALETIGILTTIKIPFKGYGYIPLEVGLSTLEIHEDIKVEAKNRKEVIHFLKNDIISPYRRYYKSIHKHSVKETFILFTEDLFSELERLDKKYCERIPYEGKTFSVADVGKIQQRCKVIDFLRKIGYPNSRTYWRIDEVYIPPVEYEDIREMLKKENIVFITGTQEYGKTYTAVRLMWEFYNEGYEPVWIKGGEVIERNTARRRLEEIRAELRPNRIIYFEDPFGKTTYEKRDGLEKEIGMIIECVRRSDDVYVVITSREEVFKEFEKEMISKRSIREFERSLNLRTPSYDYEKRKELLLKWAENEGCIWLRDESLRNSILGSMRNIDVLPTPLRIWSFAFDTANVDRKDKLEEKINEKSEEVAIAFSREIRTMSDDKILFLSFLFISEDFEVGFVRKMYEEMVDILHLGEEWEFDRVLNWFKNDKVNVGEYLRFSHPVYSEALEYLLVENGYITRINKEIFSKLLITLSARDEAARIVVQAIGHDFNRLPEEVKKLWFTLAEKDETARSMVIFLLNNFNKLPEEVRNNLLITLSKKDEAAHYVARAVVYNFNELPEEVRNLLFILSKKDKAAHYVAWAVASNFNKLPEEVRNNLLIILAEKDEAAHYVARAVVYNFDKLPEEVRNLLFTLSKKDKAAGDVAWAVADNFDKLPEKMRNNLLIILSKKDKAAHYVAWAVADNFDKLPEEVRNNLLITLSKKDEAAGDVARAVADNFNKLPEKMRNNLLIILSKKDKAAHYVAWAVADNFNKLPEEVRNLLFTLSKKDKAAGDVAWAVVYNFDKLPEEVRNLLFILSKKDEAAHYVARAVVYNFNELPEEVRNNLLITLSKKDEAAGDVALAVADNFNKLPEKMRNNLLIILSKKDEAAHYVARAVADNFDKLPEEVRNNLLITLSKKDEAAGDVARAVADNFNKLPEKMRNNLLITLSKKDEAAGDVALAVADNFNKLPEKMRNNLLITLAEKDKAAGDVAWVVSIFFNELPEKMRNRLLALFAEKGITLRPGKVDFQEQE